MSLNMTICCTNETRVSSYNVSFVIVDLYDTFFYLLISGMGFRHGHWFGRSGIQEDSIVVIKGVKIERRVEGSVGDTEC